MPRHAAQPSSIRATASIHSFGPTSAGSRLVEPSAPSTGRAAHGSPQPPMRFKSRGIPSRRCPTFRLNAL
eukprot:3086150-Prymnesium_polylepis.1